MKEHRDRPEAVKALNDMLNISMLFLNSAKNLSADQQIFTDVEISTLDKLVTETNSWLNNSLDVQNKQAASAPLKLTTKQIAEKLSALDREVKYLVNKLKFTPPKKKVEDPKAKEEPVTENKSNDDTSEEVNAEDGESESTKDESEKQTVNENETNSTSTSDDHSEPNPSKTKEHDDPEHTEL